MSRPYRKIVAEYQRQYPHQVRLQNTGDWRFDHCSRALSGHRRHVGVVARGRLLGVRLQGCRPGRGLPAVGRHLRNRLDGRVARTAVASSREAARAPGHLRADARHARITAATMTDRRRRP